MDTLTEVYEPQWTGQDLLTVQGQNSEMLWAKAAHTKCQIGQKHLRVLTLDSKEILTSPLRLLHDSQHVHEIF